MSLARMLQRLGCIMAGALVMTLVVAFLDKILPVHLELSSRAGLILYLFYFALGGMVAGIIARLACDRAGPVDSIFIGTSFPLFLFWSSRALISEPLPLVIALFLSLAGFWGSWVGTALTKRFRTADNGATQV